MYRQAEVKRVETRPALRETGGRGKKPGMCTYDITDAANFLHISEEALMAYVQLGQIQMQRHGGRDYFLGGELDMLKSMIHPGSLVGLRKNF